MTDKKTQDNFIICIDGEEREGMSSVGMMIHKHIEKIIDEVRR